MTYQLAPNRTSITVSLNDNTGNAIKIFNDDLCKSQIGSASILNQNDVEVTLSNIPAGDNSLYAIYIDDSGVESRCYDLNSTYSVYSISDITAEKRNNEFHIASTQHSLWVGNQYPASNMLDNNFQTFAHTDHSMNTQTPHWLLFNLESSRLLTKLSITSRDGFGYRFRDLDIELLDDDNQVVYKYSNVAGEVFQRKGPEQCYNLVDY